MVIYQHYLFKKTSVFRKLHNLKFLWKNRNYLYYFPDLSQSILFLLFSVELDSCDPTDQGTKEITMTVTQPPPSEVKAVRTSCKFPTGKNSPLQKGTWSPMNCPFLRESPRCTEMLRERDTNTLDILLSRYSSMVSPISGLYVHSFRFTHFPAWGIEHIRIDIFINLWLFPPENCYFNVHQVSLFITIAMTSTACRCGSCYVTFKQVGG